MDFQTVFEILAAVEGFSVWKLKPRVSGISVRLEESPPFGEVEKYRQKLTEAVKSDSPTKNLIRVMMRHGLVILWQLVVRITKLSAWYLLCVMDWVSTFIVTNSAYFSIPLLASCYLLPWGVDGTGTLSPLIGRCVFYFIVVKVASYGVCVFSRWAMKRCVQVKPSSLDAASVVDN